MSETAAFHHLGVACRSVEREAEGYAALGYRPEGDEFDDPGNGIQGVFLCGPGPRIELVVDRPGARVVEPWLRHGSTVYHIAFEVDDLTRAIEERAGAGAKLISPPNPAVAFGGRCIAFLVLRNRMLVELIARR